METAESVNTARTASPIALPAPPRYRFTVEQYMRIIDEGILPEDLRVELIEGEIMQMSPIGPHHASCVTTLNWLLTRAASPDVRVAVQNPIHVSRSIPQPDLAIIRARNYTRALPTVADVLLVIEVADSTRESDRKVKLPLYAAAGIPEAWLVDLVDIRREGTLLDSVVVPGIRVAVDAVVGSEE